MKSNKIGMFSFMVFFAFTNFINAQEILKSDTEKYYDFLSLYGIVERPYLNYRTLSDSNWEINEDADHVWKSNNLGIIRPLFGDVLLRIYGPELFSSFNTTAPYGQNDGGLWQGRGYNMAFTTGVRLEGYGVELTLRPQISFSQNMSFDIMPSAYDSEYGYYWAYYSWANTGIDLPQRFGAEPFFAFDWGDSEVRYSWKNLTVGFGTQPIWLGPAFLNPVLHSNNAPAYPKFDIGLRKQPVTIPWINWYAGDIETRLWVGYLSESPYFDNNDSNNHNMIHGLTFAYSPSFLPGLSLFANRICLVPFKWENLKYILPSDENTSEDQKASFGFSYLLTKVGFEIFGEIGVDDYVPDLLLGYLRHPFHTTVYTLGFKKAIQFSKAKEIYGELAFEFNWMEMTQTFYFRGNLHPYSFYFHHMITQGYTNEGQLLANASSPGGNSQYLSLNIYYPKGSYEIIIARNNPDTNYLITHGGHNDNFWANFILGFNTKRYISSFFNINGGIVYDMIINEHFKKAANGKNILRHNFSLQLGLNFSL
jgi:hypothetical protein